MCSLIKGQTHQGAPQLGMSFHFGTSSEQFLFYTPKLVIKCVMLAPFSLVIKCVTLAPFALVKIYLSHM